MSNPAQSRYRVLGTVGPQKQIRLFWLVFFFFFLGLWFLRSGVTVWLPVGVAAYLLIFAALNLGRKAAMGSWFIETDGEGFTVNLFGASYVRYEELESLDRHGEDVTFHFTQPIPLSIIPGFVPRRRTLKLKAENAQGLVDQLSRPKTAVRADAGANPA